MLNYAYSHPNPTCMYKHYSVYYRHLFMYCTYDHLLPQKCSIGFLLYLGDNLACLPYSTLEEPLFVVHHIDLTVSVTGSNLLQQFREVRIISAIY